jgi:outer membrane protein assembly factor BamB
VGAQENPADVTTYHHDPWRTGWNAHETTLSPAAVRNGSFGELHSIALDEQVDVQPLVVSNLDIDGRPTTVVYVATEKNTIFAMDASSGAILRTRSLGTPVPQSKVGCGNNSEVVGINSTPVIDRKRGLLYIVTFTLENDKPVFRMRALDLITLADRINPPLGTIISGSTTLKDGSKFDFNPEVSRQRSALLLANGNVYAAFASFCDHNHDITRGWLLAWQAADLTPLPANEVTDRRASTPQSYFLSSIWMSGYGPAADESGNVYFITGNSDKDAAATIDPKLNLQESVVKMKGDLSDVLDYFTPSEMQDLDRRDLDFAAGGAMLIPGTQPGPVPHLAIAAGKNGKMYLLDRDKLGKFAPSGPDQVLDTVNIFNSDINPNTGACWCGQSYFIGADGVGRVVSSGGQTLMGWKVQTSGPVKLIKDWEGQERLISNVFQKGFFTSVSSNGQVAESAVVWAVQRPTKKPPELTLWAFDGKDGTKLAALPAGAWPHIGGAANTVPIVSNGQVYVASYKELKIFGLNAPPPQPAAPSAVTAASASATVAPPIGALTPGSRTILHGIPKTLDDESAMTFATCAGGQIMDVKVNIAKAKQARQTPVLVPGRSLVVYGSVGPDRVVTADRIDYGGDLLGQGPGCPP